VHPHLRRIGLAASLKAAPVLAHAHAGWRAFATGGADINKASAAMSTAVGYRVTEVWHTYARAN